MSLYGDERKDRPRTWFQEFRAEIISDHKRLVERQAASSHGGWSFAVALCKTQEFYRERLTGYQSVGAITSDELGALMALVDVMGDDAFLAQAEKT